MKQYLAICAVALFGQIASAHEDQFHQTILDLAPKGTATNVVVQSGNWSDPKTWDKGIPKQNARVFVPVGFSLVNDTVTARIDTLRVDGEFSFASKANTTLFVDTVVFNEGSKFTGNVTGSATVVFTDNGDVSDRFQLRRGLIGFGGGSLKGTPITAWVALAPPWPKKGDMVLRLESAVTGWKPGHELVLSGIKVEELTVKSVAADGKSVLLQEPIANDHVMQKDLFGKDIQGAQFHVGNKSRNVVFRSESKLGLRRGHVLFTHVPGKHSQSIQIENVRFQDLGRTSADSLVTDAKLLPDGTIDDGTLVAKRVLGQVPRNERGRYSLHFHHRGVRLNEWDTLRGLSVDGGKKVGIANHQSHVICEDCFAYDVDGSAFFTEAGNELGAWRSNLSVFSRGVTKPAGALFNRESYVRNWEHNNDAGFEGHGFWIQAPLVELVDNVASHHRTSAYDLFTAGTRENGIGTQIPAGLLSEPVVIQGRKVVPITQVPLKKFARNVGYLSHHALGWYGHHPRVNSVFEDSLFWGIRTGGFFYSGNGKVVLRRVRYMGVPGKSVGLFSFYGAPTVQLEDCHIEGFDAVGTHAEIRGGYYNNLIEIAPTSTSSIVGAKFDTLPAEYFAPKKPFHGRKQYDVVFLEQTMPAIAPSLNEPEIRTLIAMLKRPPSRATVTIDGKYLYHEVAEDPGYVWFKNTGIPELDGKTVAELLAPPGNLAFANSTIPPAGQESSPRVKNAKIGGPPVQQLPKVSMVSPPISNVLKGYKLTVRRADARQVVLGTFDLIEGMNFLKGSIDGVERTIMVVGDTKPPSFVLDKALDLRIHPSRLGAGKGFTATGTIREPVLGRVLVDAYQKTFTNLTESGGVVKIPITFRDAADNQFTTTVEVKVDPKAPL